MLVSREASAPILQTVSATAHSGTSVFPLSELNQYMFSLGSAVHSTTAQITPPLAISPLKVDSVRMFVLRVPSFIKLCRTEDTSWACANETSVGFGGLLRGPSFLPSQEKGQLK